MDTGSLVAVVLAMIAMIGTLAKIIADRRTAKDVKESDEAKVFLATLVQDVKENRTEIARLQTKLEERDAQHAKELDAMRLERDQEKDEKHKVQSDFQHAELMYQKNLDDMELRFHKEAAELKRCYELEITELRHEVQQLRDVLTGAGIPVPKKSSNHAE